MATFEDEPIPCTACDELTTQGLKRRYTKQWVLAGLPLYTIEWGENEYCPDCIDPDTLEPIDPDEDRTVTGTARES